MFDMKAVIFLYATSIFSVFTFTCALAFQSWLLALITFLLLCTMVVWLLWLLKGEAGEQS